MIADPTKRRSGATTPARSLRSTETEAEYRLWGELRGRNLNGFKFVRQIPLGPYVVDFVCREKGLIVELDGSQHAESSTDIARTYWLNRNGYSVLRFWNQEVLAERHAVLETILAVLEGQIFAPSPGLRFAPATLSPGGRGGRHSPSPGRIAQAAEQEIGGAGEAGLSPLPGGERVAAKRTGEGVA